MASTIDSTLGGDLTTAGQTVRKAQLKEQFDAAVTDIEAIQGGTGLNDGAVTYAKIQNVVSNNVLLGNDNGAGSDVQELTAAEVRTILNVEDGADATDATNVNAAGATMNTDTDVSGNSWVVDEDDMASDLNTKVPTQQSVKAYVDAITRPTVQVFTSSGTWTRPSGCKTVIIEVQGAGGGGGGGDQGVAPGGGGGGGGYARKVLDVTGIASSTITVGAKGTKGALGGGDGTDGGDSSWADGTNTITGAGGNKGTGAGNGGSGGGGTNGDMNVTGGNGGYGNVEYGPGGGSFMGSPGFRLSTTYGDGLGYGSGGAGGFADGSNEYAGGDGFGGVVIVTEFY